MKDRLSLLTGLPFVKYSVSSIIAWMVVVHHRERLRQLINRKQPPVHFLVPPGKGRAPPAPSVKHMVRNNTDVE